VPRWYTSKRAFQTCAVKSDSHAQQRAFLSSCGILGANIRVARGVRCQYKLLLLWRGNSWAMPQIPMGRTVNVCPQHVASRVHPLPCSLPMFPVSPRCRGPWARCCAAHVRFRKLAICRSRSAEAVCGEMIWVYRYDEPVRMSFLRSCCRRRSDGSSCQSCGRCLLARGRVAAVSHPRCTTKRPPKWVNHAARCECSGSACESRSQNSALL
jgi:hypothetical protein